MNEERGLPSAVVLLRDFVNTREPQVGAELFSDPGRLQAWLTGRRLLPAHAVVGPTDLDLALTIREGLRGVLLSHNGDRTDAVVQETLNRALARVPVRVEIGAVGERLRAIGDASMDHAVAALVDAIRQCAEDHSWTNLKVCARDSCRWAFYDSSRNHARRWCSMAGCGNHIKMQRAYAARKDRNTL